MKNYVVVLLSVFVFSCQQKNNNNAVDTSDTVTTEKIAEPDTPIEENKTEENKQIGDTILMNAKNEEGLFIAEGSLDSLHPRVYVKFRNDELGKLNGTIIPTTGKGNIRFNQIISPDNASDGPFGMDIKTDLKQKGNYILVIGHSQMADSPFWGKFKVQLQTTK